MTNEAWLSSARGINQMLSTGTFFSAVIVFIDMATPELHWIEEATRRFGLQVRNSPGLAGHLCYEAATADMWAR